LRGAAWGVRALPCSKQPLDRKEKKKNDRWNRDVIDTYKAARERSILDRES